MLIAFSPKSVTVSSYNNVWTWYLFVSTWLRRELKVVTDEDIESSHDEADHPSMVSQAEIITRTQHG